MAGIITKIRIRVMIFWIAAIVCNCLAGNPEKVIGGRTASIHMYPYLVSVLQGGHGGNHPFCAGSIVKDSFILTTASCVILELFPVKAILSNIKISAGTNDKYGIFGNGSIHMVSQVIHHEFYNDRDSWVNDIALLKLETPIKFSLISSKIHLPRSYIRNRETLGVPGWGGTARYFRKIEMICEMAQECSELYSKFLFSHHSQGCATTRDFGEVGVVEGDSGDPMVRGDQLVGIISVNIPQRPENAIFTKIWQFKDWFHKVISVHYI